MSKVNWWLVMASTGIVALIIVLFLLPVRLSSARDFGQWDRSDPLVQWHRTLMMPEERISAKVIFWGRSSYVTCPTRSRGI
jgi:hypothetical protein